MQDCLYHYCSISALTCQCDSENYKVVCSNVSVIDYFSVTDCTMDSHGFFLLGHFSVLSFLFDISEAYQNADMQAAG